jgi:hypothetical protein
MRLKIVYTPEDGLKLVNADTGEEVEGFVGFEYTCDARKNPEVTIKMRRIELDISGEEPPLKM